MGSPAKLKAIFDRLREQGFTDEQLDRLQAPVGLPIGSSIPEEIAVSVAAQILRELLMIAYMGPFDDRRNGSTHGRRKGASRLALTATRTVGNLRRR